MIYQTYQLIEDSAAAARHVARHAYATLRHHHWDAHSPTVARLLAGLEQVELCGFTHERPPFEIEPVTDSHGALCPIDEEVVYKTDFCHLVRFRKAGTGELPRLLLVAPMSGHFATLLRGTVQTLVQDHEVYLTDWLNIRDIPAASGEFDLDSYTGHIIEFMQHLGPGAHLMGVCQPTVSCLAAAAVMAEDGDPCTPASLILLAGPIDARINPTTVNDLATSKPIEWFEQKLIGAVPFRYKGAGRKVYPGFLQLAAFMSMNSERHRQSFRTLFDHRSNGEHDKAEAIRKFYREYFAVMDLSAAFYIGTVREVFQEHRLARGLFRYRGRTVDPRALRRTFLLTVEGERDDICGMGQTLAAQDLCRSVAPYRKMHHLQAGAGHYGVFSGKRWSHRIYPVVRSLIQDAA